MDTKDLLVDTFKWLFIGLLVCFGCSYFCSMSYRVLELVYGGYNFFILVGAELVLCIVLSLCITKMEPTIAKLLYLLYTALTGISLNGIFLVYVHSSIAFIFLVTAVIFGIFAIIGKTTNIDLSKWGTYLFIALIAIIVLEVVNMFLLNKTLDMGLCIITIVLFAGYVAFDINRLLRVGTYINNAGIYFAFQLFIDFINIFIKLLRLFGRRND